MAQKKKKAGKAKSSKGAKGSSVPGKGLVQPNPGDYGDDATVAELLVGSETTAGNAGVASVEESLISGAIEASLESSRQEKEQQKQQKQALEKSTTKDVDAADMEFMDDFGNDFTTDQELQSFADGSNSTTVCPHLKKVVNVPNLRRALIKLDDWEHCHGCRLLDIRIRAMTERMDAMFAKLALDELGANSNDPLSFGSLWLCLSCGEINCGRAIKEHAVAHFEQQKKEHPLTMNLASMDCWCYECDDQIVPSQGRNPLVQECQTVITKILQSRLAKARAASIALARKNKGALIDGAPKAMIFTPGLQNLGNTCFFNSTVQVLTETKSLKKILGHTATPEEPVSLSATTESGLGPLTTTFKDFLFTMWKQSGGTVIPRDLFTQIAKKWKVFRGMKEQDSQELMRFLFDGIKEEELESIKKNRKEQDSAASKKTEASRTFAPFIETCFGGKLVSVIVCDACKKCSYSHEDYFDLSLPLKGPGAAVNPTGGSLRDRLLAQSKASNLNASFTTLDDTSHPIPKSEQGSEAHLLHVEKLLKNVGHSNTDKLSIERSLNQFTSVDYLEGDNKFACENCYKVLQSNKVTITADDASIIQNDQAGMENTQDESKDPVSKEGSSDSDSKLDQDEKKEKEKGLGVPRTSSSEPKHIMRRAYKRYLISSLPPTLVLHLKRFEQTGLRPKKMDDQVDIPVELDMSSYVIPKSELFEEGDDRGGENSNGNGALADGNAASTKYRLYGAVVHVGSLATGHYTNYVLSSKVELAPSADKKDASVPPTGAVPGLPDIPLAMLEMQRSGKRKGRGKKSGPQQHAQAQKQAQDAEAQTKKADEKEKEKDEGSGTPLLSVMTRTRTGDYKDPNTPRERRQSRSGISDARAIPKKLGAGAGNWGVLGSEQEQDATSSKYCPKVIDADTFSRLQNTQTVPVLLNGDANRGVSSSNGQAS
ncbi:Ubiquitin carboxyl-terminal hydrolase 16 [Podila humilis]|nr:Ubiquitin carboxyl-terminal hydrolase 16 [Podila humilis]